MLQEATHRDLLMAATKIATCCYCGTKAALVLRGRDRHELACGNCGAPLRSLKMLHASPEPAAMPAKKKQQRSSRKTEHFVARPKKRRTGKSFGRRVFSEIWDVIEDVVDEVFD
jgi:hypothetical protein